MAGYTHLNLKEVEDQAPKFDMSHFGAWSSTSLRFRCV